MSTHANDWQRRSTAERRQRISRVYDPDLVRSVGHLVVEQLGRHLQHVESGQGPVLNWADPVDYIDQASRWLQAGLRDTVNAPAGTTDSVERASELNGSPRTAWSAPAQKDARADDPLLDRFHELFATILAHGQNLHHPHYVGHQVPPSIPLAGWFDAIVAVTNQVMAVYEMGPWATAVEEALVTELGGRVGFEPGRFAGLVTHGGSLANLTGLLTARNVGLPTGWQSGLAKAGTAPSAAPVIVAHTDVHYSITRAAGTLGIGTDQVLAAKLDDRRRIDPSALRQLLTQLRSEGRPVIAVAACACATPIGAFDRLNELADVCRDFGVWLHVDAAHGGAAVFSRQHRSLVSGLERADSVVIDAHKMMFMPALCAFVFYRERSHRFETFQQDAPYLFDPSHPGMAEYDSGMKTLECTKRAAGLGLWGIWSVFGPELFEDLVDTTFDLGQEFFQRLQTADDFEPLHEPQCNIVVFRYLPDWIRGAELDQIDRLQLELRRRVMESGDFYLVQSRLEGKATLRVTLINPLTTCDDLDELLDCLRRHGAALRATLRSE